mmetsp:Transcript_18937/g.43946  ORF Transcript_18937/g.43946 Transcript_18937/m.43946 type:complete len:417 (+) Transcript_18937:156-1406(+)|eukprot:CAMPEP_0197183344 /NCGR_PEP_ID=MMETSP1423-20130617/7768_1 /TAXON_ID=476441 /ORGANISM="Pseudo-nitzschia heimii, Strain UNC1101" /LENGTH=416 /DNA_ID=CAMNT_0042633921 /DNA_START=145 /DNA_END=1395 /DNA_ORIENTATION=+
MAASENDPLLSLPRKTLATAKKNKGKRDKRNFRLLFAGAAMIALVVAGMIVVRNASDPNSPSSNIVDMAKSAKSMVSVHENGGFSVSHENVKDDVTFSELSKIMLHPWYEASIMAVFDDPGWKAKDNIDYESLHNVRTVLRNTRSMFDIFSPVFSDAPYYDGKKRKNYKDPSLWRKIRMQYKKGYVLLGELQDLYGVTYTDKLYNERLKKVITWRSKFMAFQKQYQVRRFLYSDFSTGLGGIDPKGHYFHDSSHLFWAKTAEDTLPYGHDSGIHVIRNLGRIQMDHCLDFLEIISNYTTVVPEEHEIEFHNLRKQMRVFDEGHNVLGDVLVPANDPEEAKTITHIFEMFQENTDKLGAVNDQWTGRDIYIQEGSHPDKVKDLAVKMDLDWLKWLEWETEHDLKGKLQYLKDHMVDA